MENKKGSTASKNYEKSFSIKTDINCFEIENLNQNHMSLWEKQQIHAGIRGGGGR